VSEPAAAGSIRIPDDLRATLVLVRHGESTYVAEGRFQGRHDPPLSALGERQAALAAAWLGAPGGPPGLGLGRDPIEIVHSPLARSARSAEAIAQALAGRALPGPAARLRPEPELVEISQGDWEGRRHAEVAGRWGSLLAAWRRHPLRAWAPGGEPLTAADRRVRATIPGLLAPLAGALPGAGPGRAAPAGAWTIVVAHDGILRILLLALLDLPLERFWAFPFALSAATVIDLADGRAALRAHNLAGHLAAALEPDAAGPLLLDRGGAL
jgi:probable phosphoglycerate mutase